MNHDFFLTATAQNYQKFQSEEFGVSENNGVHINIEMESKLWWWLKYLDWKTLAVVGMFVLLSYIIISGKMRKRNR